MSGAIETEYAAHVADMPIATSTPPSSPESELPAPKATRATPPKETPAASQKRRVGCSTPVSDEKRPVKIGIVPRISATVVAFASRSE